MITVLDSTRLIHFLNAEIPWHRLIAFAAPVAEDISPWLPSLWNLAIWIGFGFLLDVVILRLLLKAAEKTPWKLDDEIIKCFFGKVFLVSLFIGIDTGISLLPTDAPFQMIASLKPICHRLMTSLGIVITTWLVADIAISFIRYLNSKYEALPSTSIFHNIIRIAIFCVGILVILQTLGISILPILTALGVGGLAISLALKDTLENIFAGFQIIFSKQIRIGDYIKFDPVKLDASSIEGYAEDIGWRNSYIRMPNENLVIVPNAKLASSIITNYSHPTSEMAITLECLVNYYSDMEAVERLCLEAAQRVIEKENIANKKKEPKFRLIACTDVGIRFRLHIYVRDQRNELILLTALLKEVHKTLLSNGIAFSNIAAPAKPQDSESNTATLAASENTAADNETVEATAAATVAQDATIKASKPKA